MTTSMRMNDFLCGDEWMDRSGYEYLVMTEREERFVMKYGRTWDME